MNLKTLLALAAALVASIAIPACVTPQDLADLGNAMNSSLQESVSEVNASALEREQAIQDAVAAYQAGTITQEELNAAIASAQAANVAQLNASLESFGEDTVAAVETAVENVKQRTSTATGLIGAAAKGDISSILALLLSLGGGAFAAKKGTVKAAAKQVNEERDRARAMRGEPVAQAPRSLDPETVSMLAGAIAQATNGGGVANPPTSPPTRPTAG